MIRRPASRNKAHNQPFPFSAYILKSYSTEHSKKITPEAVYNTNSIKTINQYLNILELNSKIQKQSIIVNKSKELTVGEPPVMKKYPQSEKVSLLQSSVESQSPTAVGNMQQQRALCRSRMKSKTLSPVKKKRVIDNPKINAALRYNVISVCGLLGRR